MDKTTKTQALKRMAIVEGHIKKVREMIEKEDYCPNIIHQSKAVQAALRKIDRLILHGHLHTCVFHEIHGKNSQKESIIEEIVDLFKKDQVT